MSYSVINDGKFPIYMFTEGVEVEEEAIQQVRNLSNMPFVGHHIAVMPDCHAGRGSTIGTVIPTIGAVIPAAVGVDIGCGMMAVKTGYTAEDLPDDLSGLRFAIEGAVPHGRTDDGGPYDKGGWKRGVPEFVDKIWANKFESGWRNIVDQTPAVGKGWVNHRVHLGTLGTGNHFIEVCLDEQDHVWVMLHSGSRGVGNRIGTTFIEMAKKDMERYFINLPDADLAYIPQGSENFKRYVEAVHWAQDFAVENRNIMMQLTLDELDLFIAKKIENRIEVEIIQCHHNYVAWEAHYGRNVLVTRKGAVRARFGDMGIIPGSMGVGSYIVRGKGNPESLDSCSHGAGRRMSRTKAKKLITLDQHIKDTEGVECRKDASVLDESPAAYKDLNKVIAAQSDQIEVLYKLRPLLCVKG